MYHQTEHSSTIGVQKHAFSLIELSIVLVILGLLTGGILTGQNLIRAAELRSVTAQFNNFQAAIASFRDRYMAMPGDMANATAFWGALDGGDGLGADCHGIDATDERTCNGNGDGLPNWNSAATGGAIDINGERFRFWQHLANAGLIEGSYTGRTTSTTDHFEHQAGVNAPAAKFKSAFWTADGINTTTSGDPNRFDATYRGIFLDIRTGSLSFPLNTEETWGIDTKMDDGRPATGFIRAPKATGTWSPGCTTSDDGNTAEYNVADTSIKCYFFMRAY